jgi:hypothetical protein
LEANELEKNMRVFLIIWWNDPWEIS